MKVEVVQALQIATEERTAKEEVSIGEAKPESVSVKEKSPVVLKNEEAIRPEEPKQVKIEVEQSKPVQVQQTTTEEQIAIDSRASTNQVHKLEEPPVSIQPVSTVEQSSRLTKVVQNGGSVGESAATTVLTGVKQVENFYVGVEVNVDVEDMSRKYSGLSSSRG